MTLTNLTYDRGRSFGRMHVLSREDKSYNPEITMYYNSSNDMVKIKEVSGGKTYEKYITGSSMDSTIAYSITYSQWVDVTDA